MIYSHYIYKLNQLEGSRIILHAEPLGMGKNRLPEPREALASLLTAWRLLFAGLGYRELPISRAEARQLYLAAPDMSRMGILYATYCSHNQHLTSVEDYAAANVSSWYLRGAQYRGGRVFASLQTRQRAYALMSPALIYQDKQKYKDETQTLLPDLEISPLSGTNPASIRLSFNVADPALVYFLRPGMVWEYTDEFECPHCRSNAPYTELSRKRGAETLSETEYSERWMSIDIRTCQCSLCGGKWEQDHSEVRTEVNYP